MAWLAEQLESWLAPWVDRDPEGRAFDRAFQTETRWFDLGNYEPAPPFAVQEAIGALPVPVEGRSFLDLGSGKGRAVLVASRFPFTRVVGIERRPTLHAIAQRNAIAYQRIAGPGSPVHFLCGDVVDHPFPEGPLVVWMFNPFGAEVVAAVARRLEGREVHILYAWPRQVTILQARGFRSVRAGGTEDCPWQILTR
jgi:SAM-dependent methyltransferase